MQIQKGELRRQPQLPSKGKAIKLVVDQLILIIPAVQLADLLADLL